jgi:hypothetical protein
LAPEREPSSSSQNSPEPRGLLYILLSAFAFLSGWLLSKSHTPNEDAGKSASPQDYTREENHRRQLESSIISQIAPSPKNSNHSNGREHDTPLWQKIAEVSIAISTVGLLIVTIIYTCLTKKISDTAEYQERVGLMPYIDLMDAVVLEKDKPITVRLTFVNRGKTPAKNVRLSPPRIEIRTVPTRLCPPVEKDFQKYGPTYPSDSPQEIVIRLKVEDLNKRKAFENSTARLYIWGRLIYSDFWVRDRSSIFCRSFGKDSDGTKLIPCTADEWPFDDQFDCVKDVYSSIKGKCVAATPNTPHPLTYEECNQQEKNKP